MEAFELKEIEERVILVGVQENNGEDTEESLQELAELARTAGAETVGSLIQNREAIHPGTYIGKGKSRSCGRWQICWTPRESCVMMNCPRRSFGIWSRSWI